MIRIEIGKYFTTEVSLSSLKKLFPDLDTLASFDVDGTRVPFEKEYFIQLVRDAINEKIPNEVLSTMKLAAVEVDVWQT